jgi:hypothetical protein
LILLQIFKTKYYKSLKQISHFDKEAHRNDLEIDFIISNNINVNYKIYPIEVKSSKRYSIISIDKLNVKFKSRIANSYIIHPKNLFIKDNLIYIPPYMVICL